MAGFLTGDLSRRVLAASQIFAVLCISGCMQPTDPKSKSATQPVTNEMGDAAGLMTKPAIHDARTRKGSAAGVQFLAVVEPLLDTENPRLLGKSLRTDAISAERAVETRRLRPSIELSGSTVSQGVSLVVSQPLFEFGKRSARLQRLTSQENQQRLQLADARQTLAAQALTAVLSQELATKWIALTKRRISDYQKAKTNALRLVELQLTTESDVQLAEVKLNEAILELARAQNDLDSAQRDWARLAGDAPFPQTPLFPDLLNRFDVGNATAAHATALQNNLDLRLLKAEIAVQNSDAMITKTARAPTLSLQNITSVSGGNAVKNHIGLAVEMDVFSSDRRAAIARSEGMNNALAADLVNLKEDLSFEIDRLLLEAAAADKLARDKSHSVVALEERVLALEGQIDQGLATFSDLIAARSDLFDVQYEALKLQNDAQLRQAEVLLKCGVFAF